MADLPFVPDENEEEAADLGDVADADLIAAAEAALKGAEPTKPEGDKERDESGRFIKQPAVEKPAPKPEAKAGVEKEKPSSIIARELAKREAARADETQYKAKIREAEQLHAQVSDLLAQAKADREEAAKEKAAIAAARRDPAGFLAQQGWQADQFIDMATRSKDPLYQETMSLREELAKTHQTIAELRSGFDSLKAKADGYDKQNQQSQQAAEVQAFWQSLPEDSPVWQDFEEREDILYMAQKVRQRYFNKTKKIASPQEVAQYLHYKALEKRSGTSAETAASKPNAGKTKAKVPRALGGSDASERRASNGAKHIHDMAPDEERQYLMDVAAAAVTGSGD